MNRRLFLKLATGTVIGLLVKPTATFSDEVLSCLTTPISDPPGGWLTIKADHITLDEINSIMKQFYLPLIEDQIFQESPFLKALRERGAIK